MPKYISLVAHIWKSSYVGAGEIIEYDGDPSDLPRHMMPMEVYEQRRISMGPESRPDTLWESAGAFKRRQAEQAAEYSVPPEPITAPPIPDQVTAEGDAPPATPAPPAAKGRGAR
jgi:hypothetical protein